MPSQALYRATLPIVVLLLLGAGYCFLWFAALGDLIPWEACHGHFSLFAESYRCRQPYIAVILLGVQLVLAVVVLLLRRRWSRTRDSQASSVSRDV